MTTYAEALTAAVFEAIKDDDLRHFDHNFREAYLKAAKKEKLTSGQRSSFRGPVKCRVFDRVRTYQKNRPEQTPLLLEKNGVAEQPAEPVRLVQPPSYKFTQPEFPFFVTWGFIMALRQRFGRPTRQAK